MPDPTSRVKQGLSAFEDMKMKIRYVKSNTIPGVRNTILYLFGRLHFHISKHSIVQITSADVLGLISQ